VAPWEAALGASVTVPTPGGAVEMKIPAGSKSGARLRLKGRGLPSNPPGDLYATLQVSLPPADSETARAAYRAFAAAAPFDPRAGMGE
jgi:curved DNA-binding protein